MDSEEDLTAFLASLRQRYNLDATPADTPPAAAATEAAPPAVVPAAIEESATAPQRPVISTDAAILGLHPAFRGSVVTGLTSPSLKSGVDAASGRAGASQNRAAAAQTQAAALSPGGQSESGSCCTPEPLHTSASQLAVAAAGLTGVTPADTVAGAASGAWGMHRAPAAAPAGGVGAVAAVATPHSTAAMPAAWHQAGGQHSEQEGRAGSSGHAQPPAAAAIEVDVQAGPAAGAQALSPPAGSPAAVTEAEAAVAAAVAFDPPARSSGSSSPGSIAKPLFSEFTAAADVASEPAGAPLLLQVQAQQQHHGEHSSSEVTLQSLLDSPVHKQHLQQQRTWEQHHQPPHAVVAAEQGSPPRPLLGAWAARAAAAGHTRSPSPTKPQGLVGGEGLVGHRHAEDALAAAEDRTLSAQAQPDTQQDPSRAAQPLAAAALESGGIAAEPGAPQGIHLQAAAAESTGSAASDSPLPPYEQQEQQAGGEQEQGQPAPGNLEREWEQQAPDQQEREQEQQQLAEDASVDWGHLSAQLSAAGFGHLPMVEQQQQWGEPGGLPELAGLHDSLRKVLYEYQRRDSLMQQLLTERDEVRRASRRSNTESSKLERERDEAARTAARLKAELADVRAVEVPALEAKHKEALGKLSSEVSRLKHALKEAEAVAAAAQAEAAAATTQSMLQAQLHEADRGRERLRLECERLESELSRQRPLMKELEKAAAAGRAEARQAADQAALLDRELRQLRQQATEEQAALSAELNKARHTAREAEQQLAALRAEASASSSEAPELLRQLAADRAQAEEQQAHLTSELQALRQQLLQVQQAAAKAEGAAKADSSAALHAQKQLLLQEKQHKAEVARMSAELRQARESLQLLQARLLQAESTAADQASAATGAEAAAVESADRAAAAVAELERVRSAALQQQQQLQEQLQDSRRALAECQQQLTSTQGELRRLRAATALADATVPAPAVAAAAGGEAGVSASDIFALGSEASIGSSGLSVEPLNAARAVRIAAGGEASSGRPGKAAGAAAAAAAAGLAAGATGDLAAALSRAVAAEVALADAEGALVGLRYRCMQLEMSCSRKEQELDSLRDKLAQKVIREERRLARDKAAYQRIKQAYAASGGAAAGRRAAAAASSSQPWSAMVEIGPGSGGAAARRSNAAGAVAAAARELRPVELVGIYEGQKEALENELAAAKAEVRVLSGQLRDAQNLLISRDRAAAVAAAAAGAKGAMLPAKFGDAAEVAASNKKAAELQRELCTVRAEAASALREAAKRLAETESEVSQLRGDVHALQEELDNRPTTAEQRRLQREIDLLQRKIAAVRRQAATAQPGGAAAAGEDSLAAAAAAGDLWGADDRIGGESGRSRGTKTAIQRDKALASLGLHVVEEFPRDVLVDIVQDMCIVLDLRDATLLVPSLKKIAAVAAAIPSVELFVAQVCEVVLREGLAFTPPEVQDTGLSPKCVPQVLSRWLQLLRQGELLSQFAVHLQHLVAQRCGTEGGSQQAAAVEAALAGRDSGRVQQMCQQLVQEVQTLLQVESEAVAAADVLGAAKGLLVSQPEGLLQRLVLQVMQLLGVERLEGLPASVNRVYVHYNELLNFLRAVVSLLSLPSDAGPSAVMAALAKLVEQAARPPSMVRQAAAELQAAAGIQPTEQQQQQQQHREADSLAFEAAAAAAASQLTGLLEALGAVSERQAVERHREMVSRLRRLDQVLPKYQSVLSELYDRLRVVSMDDLLPAVDKILMQLELKRAVAA